MSMNPRSYLSWEVCSTSKIFLLKKIGHCLLSLQSRRAFQDRRGVWPQDESDYFYFCGFGETMQTLAHVASYSLLPGRLGGWKCIISLWGQLTHFSSLPGNGKGQRWWEHRVIWTSKSDAHGEMVRTLRLVYRAYGFVLNTNVIPGEPAWPKTEQHLSRWGAVWGQKARHSPVSRVIMLLFTD